MLSGQFGQMGGWLAVQPCRLPGGGALAVSFPSASTDTWSEDSRPANRVPCPARTLGSVVRRKAEHPLHPDVRLLVSYGLSSSASALKSTDRIRSLLGSGRI